LPHLDRQSWSKFRSDDLHKSKIRKFRADRNEKCHIMATSHFGTL